MRQLAELVLKLTGSKGKLVFKPLPSDDPKQRRPDIRLAKEKLGGWEPKIQLEEGPQTHHRLLPAKCLQGPSVTLALRRGGDLVSLGLGGLADPDSRKRDEPAALQELGGWASGPTPKNAPARRCPREVRVGCCWRTQTTGNATSPQRCCGLARFWAAHTAQMLSGIVGKRPAGSQRRPALAAAPSAALASGTSRARSHGVVQLVEGAVAAAGGDPPPSSRAAGRWRRRW